MTKPMSTLRRHMIEGMTIRNLSPNGQKGLHLRRRQLRCFPR
jgi:hypothetical protein